MSFKEEEAFLCVFNNVVRYKWSLAESLCLFLVCFINRAATTLLVG